MSQTPHIIGIIGGTGKMGRFFAKFFQEQGYRVLISGRSTSLTNQELVKKVDVVIVSVLIENTIKVIREIAPLLKSNQLLMDFTSLKVEPVKEMLKSSASVIGVHPLFGPTNSLANQIIILCPARAGKWLAWVNSIFEKGEAIVKILEPKEHDLLMSVIQGLTHFSNLALIETIAQSKVPLEKFLEYQSPVYRLKMILAARTLAQDSNLYGPLTIENPYSEKILKKYLEVVQNLVQIIQCKDLKKYEKNFCQASTYLKNFKETAQHESDYLIENVVALTSRKSGKVKKNMVKTSEVMKKNFSALGVLGPKNTHSDAAADAYLKIIPTFSSKYFFSSISGVIEAIEKGLIKEGIVPIENKLEGSIHETIDGIFRYNLFIQHIIRLPIHHMFVIMPDVNPKKIETIYSHPQVLAQCRKFLRKNYPKADLVETLSTVAAMQKIVCLKNSAAIGSMRAATDLHLKILAKNIEDNPYNVTDFAIVSKDKTPTKDHDRIGIAFYFTKNEPGALDSIFSEFATKKIDLTHIESRPAEKKFGEYVFFLDFKGNLNDELIKQALANIAKKTAEVKIIGAWKGA